MFSGVCALTIALALQASPPPASSRPPVSANIFKEFGHDFRAMPSSANAAILGFGAGAAAVLRHDDTRVANWSLRRGPAAYTPAGDRGGNGWVQASLALATYGIGVASRSPRGAEVGGDLVRGQLLAGIVTQVLKSTVDRTRPTGGSRSFPSGHTSATFLTAAVLQGDLGWKVGAPAYAAATFVAWSRVRDREHWLTDVVVGSTIGTFVGQSVTSGHLSHSRWTVVPAPTAGGVAVFVMAARSRD